jgi:hypothetical protein
MIIYMETFKIGPIGQKKSLRRALYRQAAWLAVVTILYNLFEGAVSVYFGMEDETLALFGFGLDSFVEVISGAGILHMVMRTMAHEASGVEGDPDRFEATALRITGGAFYLLSAGLVVTAVLALAGGHAPVTTFWGVVISLVSIVTMWILIKMKLKVGRALGSNAILADAECTKVCFYLSIVLLASSLGFELTGIGGLDSIGAVVIAVFSYREGRESFEKARGEGCGCETDCKSDFNQE